MNLIERRIAPLRLAVDAPASAPTVEGYAVRWGDWSQLMAGPRGQFRERFVRGSFDVYLSGDFDTSLRFLHDPRTLLARRGSGSLSLVADDVGLLLVAELPDTSLGRDVASLMRRGDLAGLSVGFVSIRDRWSDRSGDAPLDRDVLAAALPEVSIVPVGAYSSARASLRSLPDPSLSASRAATLRRLSLELHDAHTPRIGR